MAAADSRGDSHGTTFLPGSVMSLHDGSDCADAVLCVGMIVWIYVLICECMYACVCEREYVWVTPLTRQRGLSWHLPVSNKGKKDKGAILACTMVVTQGRKKERKKERKVHCRMLLRTCVCTFACISVCWHICMHVVVLYVFWYACLYVCMYVCIYIFIHIYVYVCI